MNNRTTMTVKQLRDYLANQPDDMPVVAEWESVWAGIRKENIGLEQRSDNGPMILVINVDMYGVDL